MKFKLSKAAAKRLRKREIARARKRRKAAKNLRQRMPPASI